MVARVFGKKDAQTVNFEPTPTNTVATESIFTRQNLRFNISLSLAFFCCSYVTFGVSSWITVMLISLGLEFSDAAQGLLAFNFLAVASAFFMPSLLDLIWLTHHHAAGSKSYPRAVQRHNLGDE